MITVTQIPDTNQIELTLTGQITQDDYKTVLVPALESALSKHDRLRMLCTIDKGFTGYDLDAMWADTKMGLAHWSGFDRIAVATDTTWISVATRAFAPVMPCPVKIFPLQQTDDARRWLRESMGSIHVKSLGGPAIEIALLGKPDTGDYEKARASLDALIPQDDAFRLLLDLRAFEGWHGLSAIWAHMRIATTHIGLVTRVALVGDKGWEHLAQRVASHMLNADSRYFDAAEYEAAKVWISEG